MVLSSCKLGQLMSLLSGILFINNANGIILESSINYQFSQKLSASKPSKKPIEAAESDKAAKLVKGKVKMDCSSVNALNLPQNNYSVLELEARKKKLPIKVVPKFDPLSKDNQINRDYLLNSIRDSDFTLYYKSTLINVNQNALNITYTY